MVREFPGHTAPDADNEEIRITLDLTFDLPKEVADQLEMWGVNEFDSCAVDPNRRQVKMSARTTLYRKGA
ncbi:hypothetical protein [uncultured Oscillibacter sp.]|uniref:hypothetical protein n=1 Tax=uncultured Oscillibacter sp. TaxID=876091 RepID=UPI0026074C2C|nr:hypothetical protein [uncultured Oscillibacter sp.]